MAGRRFRNRANGALTQALPIFRVAGRALTAAFAPTPRNAHRHSVRTRNPRERRGGPSTARVAQRHRRPSASAKRATASDPPIERSARRVAGDSRSPASRATWRGFDFREPRTVAQSVNETSAGIVINLNRYGGAVRLDDGDIASANPARRRNASHRLRALANGSSAAYI